MNNTAIQDIIHDYVTRTISEDAFRAIKKENPEINWDSLVKEELLMQSMFQAKFYESLEEKISRDIDKIERVRQTKKISLLSVAALAILGGGYFISTTKTSEEKPIIEEAVPTRKRKDTLNNSSIKVDTLLIEHTIQKNPKSSVNSTKKAVEAAPTSINTSEKLIDTLMQKDTSKNIKPNTTSTSLDSVAFIKPIVKTVKKEIIDSSDSYESTELIEKDSTTTDKEEPIIKEKIIAKSYIINPNLEDYLTIQAFDFPVTLSIQNINGKMVFNNSYNVYEDITWEGIDLNSNKLSTGLYIYQVKKEGETVQFGQITITQ